MVSKQLKKQDFSSISILTEGSRGQEESWGLAQAWGTSRKVRPKYRKGREDRTKQMSL